MLTLASGVAALLCAAVIRAQQPSQPQTTAPREQLITISGRILIASGMREAPGVHVQLLQGLGMPVHQTYTDSQGTFEFRALKRAMYMIEAQSEGFEAARRSVDLSQMWGAAVRVTILLQPMGSVPSPPTPGAATASVRELQIPEKARKAFEKGVHQLVEQERPNRSVSYFQEAIALYAYYDEAYLQLSLAYLDQGQVAAAQKTLEDALSVNALNVRALTFLGVVYRRQEQPEKAAEILGQAVQLPGADWLSHVEFAESLLQLGKMEEAQIHAHRAHDLNQQALSVHLLLAGIAIHRKEFRTAIGHLDEFLHHPGAQSSADLVRRHNEILNPLADAASAAPDALWRQTMDAARRALDHREYGLSEHLLTVALGAAQAFNLTDVRRVATHSLSGSVYQAQQRYQAAEDSYKKSLAILEETAESGPVVAITRNNLAEVYYLQGRYHLAEPYYQRSLATLEKTLGPAHPNLATALENYSALLRATGRVREAKEMEARAKTIRAKFAQRIPQNK